MSKNSGEKLFSIVVPACNVSKYAVDMLNSIRNQTYPDFEALILVEESTDDTSKICREQTKDDPRFKIVPLPRTGSASNSRNYGMEHAAGKYLVFVDGDDWIEMDSLEKFAEAIKHYGDVDILLCAGNEYLEKKDGTRRFNRTVFNLSKEDEGRLFTGIEVILRVGNSGRQAINFTPLSIYRTAFLRSHSDLRQIQGIIHEDSEWVPRTWFRAERAAALAYPYYNYRKRPGSVTTACRPEVILNVATAINSLLDFSETHSIPEPVKNVWRNQWLSLFFWYFFNPQYKSKFPKELWNQGLNKVLGGQKEKRYRSFAAAASLPKRLATPLILLAARYGICLPVRAYFRFFYYPLVNLRARRQKL